jgi:hypothetical protein
MTREHHEGQSRDEPSQRDPRLWSIPSPPLTPVGPVHKVWPETHLDPKDPPPADPAAA